MWVVLYKFPNDQRGWMVHTPTFDNRKDAELAADNITSAIIRIRYVEL